MRKTHCGPAPELVCSAEGCAREHAYARNLAKRSCKLSTDWLARTSGVSPSASAEALPLLDAPTEAESEEEDSEEADFVKA